MNTEESTVSQKTGGANRRVAVIGAGIIGTMSAWQLAQRNHSVTVFERWNTPNDRGASAGESRIFRTLYKEGPEYVGFIQKAGEKWKELESAQDTRVLEWCGGLTIGKPDHPDVTAVLECAEELDLEHRVLNAEEMRAEFPAYGVDDDEIGVFDPNAGVFRPEPAVLAARNESIRLGATYRTYSSVLNIRSLPDRVVIHTADGAEAFDSVVVATGPWAAELSGLDAGTITNRQLVGCWFPATDVAMHEPSRMPISIRRHSEGAFSGFPCLDGVGVKILTHHLEWPHIDSVEHLARFVDPVFVRSAETAVARLMPHLDPTAVRVSTWTEGFTPDGAPIVGPSPIDDRVVLAVGMSGQGFKFSPMIGSVVADFVTSGSSEDALDIMNSARFTTGGSE
ncbi:N-methyl-L-tryptophan oxidase [Brevibacterium sp. p3-SID960]|uniref:N-methyl-L-tryptophan oxidase n=1 Tax=Brevibacterium sp. p3-SID960 TaxID=2916063 RepID=UPI0021A4949B|nr:N-methyl-L-tryptophan oxidase [Brevibacterium sp. p3-SID960]MCT1689559.1 N-methyl-L-tryptophan oxidase [Brevibacterium sp. p3-SID960]